MTKSLNEVLPCCSNDAVGNRREEGIVTSFEPIQQYGFITPDTFIPGRDPGSRSLYFHRTYLHFAKDSGIKEGDKVTLFYQFSRSILSNKVLYFTKQMTSR